MNRVVHLVLMDIGFSRKSVLAAFDSYEKANRYREKIRNYNLPDDTDYKIESYIVR